MGSLGVVNRLAPAGDRGGLAPSYYFAAYVGVGLPVVGLGVATDYVSSLVATAAFAILISLVAAGSAALARLQVPAEAALTDPPSSR